MTDRARKVINAALDAWMHDDGGEPTRTDQILSALAAEGLAIYDTATHAAVPREEAEWQPIETEPDEGEYLVLVPTRRGLEQHVCHSRVRAPGKSLKIIGGVFSFDRPKPTRWRPLPAPPAAEAEAQGGENAG